MGLCLNNHKNLRTLQFMAQVGPGPPDRSMLLTLFISFPSPSLPSLDFISFRKMQQYRTGTWG